MIKVLGTTLKKHWLRLSTYSGSRRLSLFSLILLFGLDIYVLGLTFDGMHEASRAVEAPVPAISEGCQAMTEGFLVLDADQRRDSLKRYVQARELNEYDWFRTFGFNEDEALPLCARIRDALRSYAGNETLGRLFRELDERSDKIASIGTAVAELESSYDTALLEEVAGQKREDSILPAQARDVKRVIAGKKDEIAALEKAQAATRGTIDHHPLTREYASLVASLSFPEAFAQARQAYDRLSFWYPVKVFLAEVSFLLPLLALAILWNLRTLRTQNHIQTLISSHLVLVCAIPVFLRILFFVIELLPHRLLAELIAALDAMNLGFLWHYVAILAGIGGGLAVIFLAQKTFFSPTRQRSTRLRKSLCRECGEKLQTPDQPWCEFCGTSQLAPCPHCGQSLRVLSFHCPHCGNPQATGG